MKHSYFIKKIASLLLLIFLQQLAISQVVSGRVKDAETKQPMAFCNVELLGTHVGTTTDARGFFTLMIPAATITQQVVVSYLGYAGDTMKIMNGKDYLEIFLRSLPGTLNEVVVTGVSRATLLRENPIAISNVSGKTIDKTIEANIIDALVKNVPGLNAVKTGPNISKPFIRGLGYNRVLTLYDGIRQEGQQWGDEHGIEVDAYNIDKAEVIKGPASLMFGSDAVAGVVSMFAYLPKEKDGKIHGRTVSEYQTNNGLIGHGFRVGFDNTKWLWIVRGSYRQAKNYTNSIDGKVYNTGFRETNIAATTGYTFAKGFTNFNATLYDNRQGIPDGSRDSTSRKFTKQLYEATADDISNRPVVSEKELNSYTLSPLHQHIQHYRLYSNHHYQLYRGEIDATLGFQQNIRREYNHPTATKQAGLFVRLNTINYGIRYNAAAFSNIELTFGANGMYQDNKTKDATDFPIPDYDLLDVGAYVYGKWKHHKLVVSGGLRYDTRRLRTSNFYVGKNPANEFLKQFFLPDISSATLQFPAMDKRFNGVSVSMGFSYQLSERINLKANIARGYRSPTITELASNGLDPGAHIIYLGNNDFVPEFSLQQDIGINANFKQFSTSLSIFNNNIDNYIYLTQLADANGNAIVDAQGNKTFQYQQANAQLYGLEATFNIHPVFLKGFSFENSFGLIYGYNRKQDYKNNANQGEYLPLIPPAKLLSSISQEINFRPGLFSNTKLKAEMECQAAQNRFLALSNTETATAGFSLWSFSIQTAIAYSKKNILQLQLQVNNAFDVAYQSNLSRLKYFEYYSHAPNGKTGMYNMGRNFCVKAIVTF